MLVRPLLIAVIEVALLAVAPARVVLTVFNAELRPMTDCDTLPKLLLRLPKLELMPATDILTPPKLALMPPTLVLTLPKLELTPPIL